MMWLKRPAAPLSSAHSAEEIPPFISEGHRRFSGIIALQNGIAVLKRLAADLCNADSRDEPDALYFQHKCGNTGGEPVVKSN